MKKIKDNFSAHPSSYAKHRPVYPETLFAFLLSLVKDRGIAWDVGTGNGQVAGVLARHFRKVYATDISQQQISNASRLDNLIYKVERAETTTFPQDFFDLVTVAQAVHWFDFNLFYKEAVRTSKPGGIIALLGYGLMKCDRAVDEIVHHFYTTIVGPYWDPERKYIDEHYQTIPFPFDEIISPGFEIHCDWNLDDLLGYLATWSAVQHYKSVQHSDPVKHIQPALEKIWGRGTVRQVVFPGLIRVGTIKK